MPSPDSNMIDYLTLGVALIAALASVLNWWHERSKSNERFDVCLRWEIMPEVVRNNTDFEDYPMVIVHNRSTHAIAITHVKYFFGTLKKIPDEYTALSYADSSDLKFPYIVQPNTVWRHGIDNTRITDRLLRMKYAKIWSKLGFSTIWVGVETMRNSRRFIRAEIIVPPRRKPDWLQKENL